MVIPKLEFVYSWIYDQNMELWTRPYRRGKEYPKFKKTLKYCSTRGNIWSKHSEEILSELSKLSKLKWEKGKIDCYIVGWAVPFSNPLTLGVYKKNSEFIDNLTHELIHRLLSCGGNMERTRPAWRHLYKKYPKESNTTINHLPVNALHELILLKFFNRGRLKANIEHSKLSKDHYKSWEIVEKDGAENILNEYIRNIKYD